MKRPGRNPKPSSQAVRARMQATRQKDTKIEVAIRHELHRRGYRYRLNYRIANFRGKPDIVFRRDRIAVYVDSCFWHACPLHGSRPKSNQQWWDDKLAANATRDRRHTKELRAAGWSVVRVWEHDSLNRAVARIEQAILRGVRGPRAKK